ncbi:long-chain fatty acid transport protein 4-like [Oppia nitens]|uniref:long-chain fatty acid transport protein 4-like n=1 Tax=Oppia nitens TaxID=1686743 RepID=UPI0023D9FD24|nr:long-chain fatty acid transport protein 4-like [Oppia nitens]
MMNDMWECFKRDLKSGIGVVEWNLLWRRWKFSNESVTTVFKKNATKNGDKIAIRYMDDKWTYKRLDQFSYQIANYFASVAGLKAGDEVAIMMNNKPEYVGIWLGLIKAGIIPAFINTNNRMDCLMDCLKAFNCKAIIYDLEYYSALTDIYDELNSVYPAMKYFVWSKDHNYNVIDSNNNTGPPKFVSESFCQYLKNHCKNSLEVFHKRNFKDILLYVFTSGTTGGKAKAAIETDARILLAASGQKIGYRLRNSDNIYLPLPLYHAFGGLLIVAQCLINGITITIADRFSASKYWADCIKHECTIGLYIGETCRYLLAQPSSPYDTQHSIRAMCGIGLRKEYWNQFKTRFAIRHIFEFYGASEGNVYLVNLNDKEGSCGFIPYYYWIFLRLIYTGCIIKVDPITYEPVRNRKGLCKMIKPGDIGCLVGVNKKISPIYVFEGYTNKNETNKKLIYNIRSNGDSGFISGDLLEMDRYGYMYYKDRIGDTFRWKGENVSTNDVEAVLQNYVNLKDCTVFGVTVGKCEGRAGMAVINAEENEIDLQELAQQLIKRLPPYAIPLFIRLSTNIELTGTYKLIKYKLRQNGFKPQLTDDLIYYFNRKSNTYERLTNDLYECIESGELNKNESLNDNDNYEVKPTISCESDYQPLVRVIECDPSVGIASLPEQHVKRVLKNKSIAFNIMVLGQTGVGKTTLMDSLFNTSFANESARSHQLPVDVIIHYYDLNEKDVHLKLGIIESRGFGDQITCDNPCKPIVDYIVQQLNISFEEEIKLKVRTKRHDTKVHLCLYMISPIGHGLQAIDIQTLKALDLLTNIIPVIGKSDLINKEELQRLKSNIMSDIENNGIKIYRFPITEPEVADINNKCNDLLPFALVASNDFITIDDKQIRVRQYPWGTVEVENKSHCDFMHLRDMILKVNLEDIRQTLEESHYECYRRHRLETMMKALQTDNSYEVIRRIVMEKLEPRLKAKEKELKAIESQIHQKFEQINKQRMDEKMILDFDRQRLDEDIRTLEIRKKLLNIKCNNNPSKSSKTK